MIEFLLSGALILAVASVDLERALNGEATGSRLSSVVRRLIKSEARSDGGSQLIYRTQWWAYRNLSKWLGAVVIAILIILLDVLAVIIGNPFEAGLLSRRETVGFIATLWQVQASVLAITFVVVVFLFQSLSNREEVGDSLFRFYVQRSFILPIAFLGLGMILSLGWAYLWTATGTLTPRQSTALLAVNSLLFVVNIFLTVFLYKRTFKFLQPKYVDKAIGSLLSDAIRTNIDEVIEKGIGRAIFRKKATQFGIRPKPSFGLAEQGDARPVDYPIEQGTIVRVADVKLSRLKRFAAKAANKRATGDKTELAFLSVDLGDRLSPLNNTIGYLDKSVYSDALSKQFRRCFIVERKESEDRLDEIFGYLKGQSLRAIRKRDVRRFERLLEKYVEGLRTFSEAARRYRQDYIDLAVQHSLFFEWPILRHLNNDFYALLRKVIKTDDKQLVAKAITVSRRILLLSLEVEEPGLASKITRFIPTYYRMALDLPSGSETRKYLVDRARRQPSEIAKVYLIPRLTNRHSSDTDVNIARQLLSICIQTFSGLLKRAISMEDLSSFGGFSNELKKMLNRHMQLSEVETELLYLKS